MALGGLDLPEWLHELLTQVDLQKITQAMTNISLHDFQRLAGFAKDRELNAETIKKLYEEAAKLSGAGTALTAAALVIAVIFLCFPWALASPLLTMLGFSTSIAATFQSLWGVNALFSLLQSAAMGGYGAPIVAGVVQGASAIGVGYSSFKLWAVANYKILFWS
ncbi:hypothetical protein E4T39_06877 [Aureobasidium subglaciale]|nr:hypothetical protein E4T39_06877 [Aureobasidium subglaciale]